MIVEKNRLFVAAAQAFLNSFPIAIPPELPANLSNSSLKTANAIAFIGSNVEPLNAKEVTGVAWPSLTALPAAAPLATTMRVRSGMRRMNGIIASNALMLRRLSMKPSAIDA